MPSEPKLITALEVRLTNFEKQLKEAGLIADREVKNIEEKFSKANPQFGATFLGSFLGNAAAQGIGSLIKLVEDLVARFRDLEKVAKLANIEMNDLFGLQEAGRKLGVPVEDVTQSVKNLAVLLDEMKRGEKNSLSKLFEVNPEALKGIDRAKLTLQDTVKIVANLVQNADTPIQKNVIAQLAGASESLVPLLEKGGKELTKLQKAAADSAPDLQKLANLAKDFDMAWQTALTNIKGYLVTGFVDLVKKELLEIINLILKIAEYTKGGIFAGGPLDNTNSPWRKQLEAMQGQLIWGNDFNYTSGPPPTGPRILDQRRDGDVAGGGTTTRDRNRPTTNIPLSTSGGSDRGRFDSSADSIEKRTRVLIEENKHINEGTEARERAKIMAELETVAMQINKEARLGENVVLPEQRKRIDEVAEAYGRAAVAIEQSRFPLATFARESANVDKQINQFAATSLNGMTDALADVVTGTKSVKDAFKSMADAIIKDLARIVIRQSITGPLAQGLLNTLGIGAPVGQTFSGAGTGAALQASMGGGAGGGVFGGGGFTGTGGRNDPAGIVHRGEFVFDQDAVKRIGVSNLNRLQKGYADGGMVGIAPLARGGGGVVNNFQVIAPPGSTVTKEESKNSTGGVDIVAYIDGVTAQNGARPGSQTSNMLRNGGVRQAVVRR